MNYLRNQRGLTILETIIVLMIAALIISGIWMAYAGANLNDRVSRTAGVVDKTLQVARDYLTSKSLPTVSAPTYLSDDLYTQGLMPSELSYKSLNGTTRVFTSPLGYDFFIQNSPTPETINGNTIYDVFEIHISFTSAVTATTQKTCLALMPKLIGTQTMINERGIIGWTYGGQSSGLPASSASTTPPGTNQQVSACAAANEAVLYFRYRP